jgi:hypothetical protein
MKRQVATNGFHDGVTGIFVRQSTAQDVTPTEVELRPGLGTRTRLDDQFRSKTSQTLQKRTSRNLAGLVP